MEDLHHSVCLLKTLIHYTHTPYNPFPDHQSEKDWTKRVGTERHLICIEDPFELSHDLGRVVDRLSLPALKKEFKRAYDLLRQNQDPIGGGLFDSYVRVPVGQGGGGIYHKFEGEPHRIGE